MAIRLLFVDANGTLLDDWPAAHFAAIAVLRAHGKPECEMGEYVRAVGQNGDYHRFYLDRGIMAERGALYAIYGPAYNERLSSVGVMPGAHESLVRLREAGVELHLLTAARSDFIVPILDHAGVHHLFSSWHYHVHNKGEQVLAVIDGMDIQPSECAMVGDLPSDVAHAKSAGITGIRLINSHVPDDLFLPPFAPDYSAASFADLAEYILGA